MKKYFDVKYGENKSQKLDIYLPETDNFTVFLYFHGGGLSGGDKSRPTVLYEYLAAHGVAVVTANYRMYPDAKYPDFLEDAAMATAWVFKHMHEYGNVDSIFVGGSSAGGYLSLMLCFNKELLAKYGLSPLQIDGFVHDAGQPTTHFNVLHERGISSRRIIVDEAAPIFYVGTEEEYANMLIIVSDNDMPTRYDQTMLLAATLREFGHGEKIKVKIMHGVHCSYVDRIDEKGDVVFGKIVCDYIKKIKLK